MEHKLINQYQHIIYIGCGASVAMDTLAGQAQKLWLIDAADQVIEQLTLQAETQDLPVCIQQALVLPQTQQATFYEYNLPWVNGPTQADNNLHRLYPGLCRTRETQQQGLGVVDLLWQCLADAEQTSNNMLIIDLEQQTQALLHALAESEVLHCFAQVLVVPPHRGQPTSLPSSLQAAHEPLPAGVQQNTQSYQLAPWVMELQRLQQQLTETQASEQKHKNRAHSLMQQLESSRQEDAAKAEALQQAEQQLNELATQCDQLSQQRDKQTKLADERQAKLQQRTQERDGKVNELVLAKKTAEQTQQQLTELTQQCDQQTKLANELQAQLELRTQECDTKANELVQAQKTAEQTQQQLAELTQKHAEQTKLASECQARLEQRTQERDAKANQLVQAQQQLAELTQQRNEQTNLANELKTQIEQRTQERDTNANELEQAKQTAQQTQQQHQQEQAYRQQLIDKELLKAETQLDLIKDILLHDKAS